MSLASHLDVLAGKHAELDRRIEREMRTPRPDALVLSDLKRQKLHIKDRMSAYGSASGR